MTASFHYQTVFVLDKTHFQECYDQTVNMQKGWQPYLKAFILLAMSAVLMTIINTSPYIAYFLLVLAAVEALGVYYHRAWWVFRQMLSRAANNEITLTVDEQGIESKSVFGQQQFLWADISQLQKTQMGWTFISNGQTQYLSDRCLQDDVQQFLTSRSQIN